MNKPVHLIKYTLLYWALKVLSATHDILNIYNPQLT